MIEIANIFKRHAFKSLKISAMILVLPFIANSSLAAIKVAGCDHVGWYCDIDWKLDRQKVYAPILSVWSEQESIDAGNALNASIRRNRTELDEAITESARTLSEAATETARLLRVEIAAVRNHADNIRAEIQASLQRQIQEYLRAQTCENHVLPAEGTPGRADQVRAQFNCIRNTLNRWKGLNEQGIPTGVANHAELTRAQVRQLLRMLELLFGDEDLDPANRQIMADIQQEFVFFNMD